MGKLQKNQSGFSAVEVILVLVIVVLIGAVGFLVYTNHNKKTTTASVATTTTTKKSAATMPVKTTPAPADPYSGWKTATVPDGITFKVPSAYTVSTNDGSDNCTGFTSATISAPASLVASAGITAKEYSIYILRYGKQSDSCAPDGFSTSGTNAKQDGFDNITSIVSSDKITSGAISGNYLSFVKDNGLAGATEALVTSNQYNSATAFTDSGTVVVGGNTYQITIEADTGQYTQNPQPATINLNSFKTSDLYKDTLSVLNSVQ